MEAWQLAIIGIGCFFLWAIFCAGLEKLIEWIDSGDDEIGMNKEIY